MNRQAEPGPWWTVDLIELGAQNRFDLARYEMHDISVVGDRLVLRPGLERWLTNSVETALRLANGAAEIEIVGPRPAPAVDNSRWSGG